MANIVNQCRLNGIELAYRVYSTSSSRPPLVFVHGYALKGTGEIYRKMMADLAEHYEVYAIDLRGHGASAESWAGWSLEALADDVSAIAHELGLVDPLYVGHSLGGYLGMLSAIRSPGTYRAMALLATAPASGGGHTTDEIIDIFTAKSNDRAVMTQFFAPMYTRADDAEVALGVDAVGEVHPSVHRAFYSTFPHHSLTDRLGTIDIPVLLVNGGSDFISPPEATHATALGLTRSKEVIFACEGHMLPIEAPRTTAREIITFFEHDVANLARGVSASS